MFVYTSVEVLLTHLHIYACLFYRRFLATFVQAYVCLRKSCRYPVIKFVFQRLWHFEWKFLSYRRQLKHCGRPDARNTRPLLRYFMILNSESYRGEWRVWRIVGLLPFWCSHTLSHSVLNDTSNEFSQLPVPFFSGIIFSVKIKIRSLPMQ